MRNRLMVGSLLALLGLTPIQPAIAEPTEDGYFASLVDYQDGKLSVAFDHTPVSFALNAIRARTGFQIDIPSTAESKLVNLKLTRSPLVFAVHSLISTIGFRNFATMYDNDGRPNRVVVIGARLEERSGLARDSKPTPLPLTPEEQDQIQNELERWPDLKNEERGRIEDRLKTLPASEERDQLVKEYGRTLLGIKK